MTEHKTIKIYVEIEKDDIKELEFSQDKIKGREIKEAAKLPLESDLGAKRDGEVFLVKNDEIVTIKNGERFFVIYTEVTIYIDKKKETSPNPTTGAALYVLGKVPVGYDLFEEIHGAGDDKLIKNDDKEIELKNHLRFYTAKQSLNPGNGK
jgi:hypothetical protein